MIIDESLYGLKNSIASFSERLAKRLRDIGFEIYKRDFDFWYRDKSDHYEYIAIYIDNIFVFSKDSINIITEIQKKIYF